MLIIDADTHIAPTGGDFALEEHLKRMERAEVDKTLTWLKPDYVGEGIEGAFVVDMNSGSASVVNEDEARSLIFQMASELPQGPENGFGSGEAGGS